MTDTAWYDNADFLNKTQEKYHVHRVSEFLFRVSCSKFAMNDLPNNFIVRNYFNEMFSIFINTFIKYEIFTIKNVLFLKYQD